MKRIITILLSIITLTTTAQKKTKISGYIASYSDTIVPVVIGIWQYDNMEQPIRNIKTNLVNGRFSVEFEINRVSTIAVDINRNAELMGHGFFPILQPGENLLFEKPDHKKVGFMDVKFSGSAAPVHHFYQNVMGPLRAAEAKQFEVKPYFRRSTREWFENNNELRKLADSLCTKYRKTVDPAVYKYARAEVLRTLYEVLMTHIDQQKKFTPELIQLVQQYIEPKYVMHDMLVDDVTRTLVPAATFRTYPFFLAKKTAGLDPDFSLLRRIPSLAIQSIAETYHDYPGARSFLLAQSMNAAILTFGKSDKIDSLMQQYKTLVFKGDTAVRQITRMYDDLSKRMFPGKPVMNFELLNEDGTKTKLSDYRGKVVILDFYFNGCGACKLMSPSLEQLHKEFADESVKFVSVSVDRNISDWKDGIGIYSSRSADQLYTGGSSHPFVRYCGIRTYPSLVIIDAKGNYFDMGVNPSKSKESLRQQINKALGR